MTEKLYPKSEVYALSLPSTYLQPLDLPLDTDVPALMKLYAKLKAQQLPSAPANLTMADDKAYFDRAAAKLFTSTPAEEAEWERKRELISRLALNGGATDAELALLKQWELLPGAYDESVPSL